MTDGTEVRRRLDDVIAAMKHSGAWDVARPRDEAFTDTSAFGMGSMAFEQWLRYVFVPNVERLIASNGPWPQTSMVAVQAVRKSGGDSRADELVSALHAFDSLFERPKVPAVVHVLAPPSPAADSYARSRAAFERGDHRAALDAIRAVLKIDPRFPNAQNYAGWILLHWPTRTQVELDGAIAHFREAMSVAPRDDAPLANLCDALVLAGREAEAIAEAQRQTDGASTEGFHAAGAHNWLGWRALSHPDTIDAAIEHFRSALRHRFGWGIARSNLGKALEMKGLPDEAYAEHQRALDCKANFDRTFSHERRAAYEARHGWLRNALESFRRALKEDSLRGATHEATYREAIGFIENQLRARGIDPDEKDREAWARARELEIPAGFGARNEFGEPLADAVIEVERLLRDERWADAIAALRALDGSNLVDAIGYASWGAKRARRAGDLASAIAMQSIVVNAYRGYASNASSGGEGLARMGDVEREQKTLESWKAEAK